jgi:hypothetical protein
LAHAIALEVVTPSLSQGSAAKTAPKSCKKYFQANRSGASLTGRSRGRRTFPIASEIPSAAPLNFGVRPHYLKLWKLFFGNGFQRQASISAALARTDFRSSGASYFCIGPASIQAQR